MDPTRATAAPGRGGRHERPLAAGSGSTRTALVVLVVAGTALGAVLLRTEGPLFGKGTGPVRGVAAVAVLLMVLAGLAVSGRYRAAVGHGQELGPVEQRLADTVRFVLVAVPVALPLLLLVLHRFHHGGGGDYPEGGATRKSPHTHRLPTPSHKPVAPRGPSHGFDLDLRPYLIAAGTALLVVVSVIAAVFLWRRLRLPLAPPRDATYGGLDDEQELLAGAVESGRRALRSDEDVRAAVIACYAAMEDSLAASGVAGRASDSPQDLLRRAARSGLLTGPGAPTLAALFREARYSTHPMGDGHRDRAADALEEIAAQLAARTAESPPAADPAAGPAGEAQR